MQYLLIELKSKSSTGKAIYAHFVAKLILRQAVCSFKMHVQNIYFISADKEITW